MEEIRGQPYTEPAPAQVPDPQAWSQVAGPRPEPVAAQPTTQAEADRAQELHYAQQIRGEIMASLARMRVLQKLAMDDNERQQTQATAQRLQTQLDTLYGEYPELTGNPGEIT